jgi:hypothetical protein
MSEPKLNRNQRREMKRLAAAVEKAITSDRLFFNRHPDREYRLRHAYTAEIEQEAILQGEPVIAMPGYRIFVVVKNLCSGSRLRMLVQGSDHAEVDVSEAEACDIFEMMQTPKTREVEAQMRATSCGEPAS